MKHCVTILFLAIICLASNKSHAQNYDQAGNYIDAINSAHLDMDKKYMAYVSAAAHGRRARKVEKLRAQVLESVSNSKSKTIDIPYYKSDNSLRQSSIDYIDLCYKVFNDDYAKIVNMEDVSERSFNEMEAYILLQELTSQKLNEASNKFSKSEEVFATKYGITLTHDQSSLGEKMEVAGKLNHYINKVYLVFFKCNWQDNKITEAMNAGKVTEIEQGRNALIKYASEGLLALDSMKNFEGDPSLAMSCKQVLQFYKKSAENERPKQLDFFLKKEAFDKAKRAYESGGDKSQKAIDTYNKAVNEMNTASNTFNQINNNMNHNRSEVLNDWNKTEKEFADTHMPHYR